MSRIYTNPQSAKAVLALLLFGSISGFVLGQEAHHPSAPVAHSATHLPAHVAGVLGAGSVGVARVVTLSSHPSTHGQAHTSLPSAMPLPDARPPHQDKDGHKDGHDNSAGSKGENGHHGSSGKHSGGAPGKGPGHGTSTSSATE